MMGAVMIIRRAKKEDIPSLAKLLEQVLMVHYLGRPDLFRSNSRKYTDKELDQMVTSNKDPIFVATSSFPEKEKILGYAFCVSRDFTGSNNMQPIRTLYIDDLCVDEAHRGKHVGTALYEHVLVWAHERGFYNVTLNVWCCNPSAMAFYQARGLKPYKVGMEQIL
jgi:ribosomal protein S18 acetylase RimI-like enzyme